jgi:hypothetical protein
MPNYNHRKEIQLGMSLGTACNKLRKAVMFRLAVKVKENICFRCGLPILTVDDFTLDHKESWFDVSVDLFWDLSKYSIFASWV